MSRILGIALCLIGLLLPLASPGQSPAAEDEFIYNFQARDTLIHVTRRLLLQPQRWPELQRRNGIRDPYNIPPGTPVRIPYSWLRLSASVARVRAVNGAVFHGTSRPAVGNDLPQGSVIETGEDGSVALEFEDGSIVTLQKASAVTLDQMQRVDGVAGAQSIRLRLNSGRLETQVKPRREVGRFEILTPVAISAVRGTQFRSAFIVNGATATNETLEGTVNVAASGQAVLVAAGFGTQVDERGTPLQPVALLPAPDLSAVPERNTQRTLGVQLQPVDGAVSYRVQLASDAQFHSIVFDRDSPDLSLRIEDLADGSYWLRARAIDSHALEGADASKQIAQHLLPDPPAPAAPAPEQRIAGASAEFSWAEVPAITRYHVQIARDAEFTVMQLERSDVEATRLMAESLPPGRYFWRIAAINSAGESGAWSLPRSYVQRATAPVLEPPEIRKRELQLRWEARPDSKYQVQLASDAQFTRMLVDTTVTAPELAVKRPRAGAYYVRVRTIGADAVPDDFGSPLRVAVPPPGWLRALLTASTLLPLLL